MERLLTLKQLAEQARAQHKKGKKIGLCHGGYDVIHAGHIEHFREAKKLCDILYVTITNDAYILKPGKPILPAAVRARHLAEIACIDGVAVVDDPSAIPAIEVIKPDFYIKGKEYAQLELDATGKILQEKNAVEQGGGKLVFTNDDIIFSSTKIQAQQGLGAYLPMKQDASLKDINQLLAKLRGLKVAVLGEMVIDRWTEVKQVGVSSKAYCPAVHTVSCINQIGGAGVVARHVANFAKEVRLFSNRGCEQMPENIVFSPIDDGECIITRFWVPSEEKRLFEKKHLTIQGMDTKVIDEIKEYKPDVLIVADFGYGLIPHQQAAEIVKRLKGKVKLAIMAQSNSSNFGFNRLDKYLNADMYVCDEREASLLLGKTASAETMLQECVKRLQPGKKQKEIFITLGRHGAAVIAGEGAKTQIKSVPNLVRKTVDTIGCGDAFYSLAALSSAAGIKPPLSLIVANMAGAVCTQWLCNEKSVTPQHILEVAKITL